MLFTDKITVAQIRALKKLKMSLQHMYYWEQAVNGKEVGTGPEVIVLRGRMLIDSEGHITRLGEQLYNEVCEATGEQDNRKKGAKNVTNEYDADYEVWWLTYPSSSGFWYKGILFQGTRALRENKPTCRLHYIAARQEGWKAETLLHSLKVEIEQRKQETYRKHLLGITDCNQFQYMKASGSYMNMKRYTICADMEMPVSNVQEKMVENSTDM